MLAEFTDEDYVDTVKHGLLLNLHVRDTKHQFIFSGYVNVGCYKDKEKRLLSSLESSFKSPLDKNYKTRLNALYKCARIAKLKGYPGFAMENGGQCFGGKNILNKYQQYGSSLECNKSGKGGPWSLNIYKFA